MESFKTTEEFREFLPFHGGSPGESLLRENGMAPIGLQHLIAPA